VVAALGGHSGRQAHPGGEEEEERVHPELPGAG
jgi:hypothetical protein